MKNSFYKLFPVLCLLFMISCKDDNKEVYLHPEGNTPAQFKDYSGGTYVFTKDEEFDTFEEFEWSDADYGPMAVKYDIQMAQSGTGFANPVTLISGLTVTSQSFMIRDIDKAVLAIDNSGNEVSVELRIASNLYMSGNSKAPIPAIYSDPVTLKITPYIDSYIPPVPGLYFIGNMQGWNASGTDFQFFRDDSDPSSALYSYTGLIKMDDGGVNTYFAFSDDNTLGSWNIYRPETQGPMSGTLVISDASSFKLTVESYYEIKADLKAMTYQITQIPAPAITYSSISLSGTFNSWSDTDLVPSAYDPHIWELDVNISATGVIKFRANHGWDVNWGGVGFPYGKGSQGGSDISVDAGTYHVRFNDITGQYIIMPK